MRADGRGMWFRLGGLGILMFLAVYTLVALEEPERNRELPHRRTTYSASQGGYKALYLWLKALKVPIERWEKPLTDLTSRSGVLLMVEPELGPGTGELNALKKWVAEGGTFVLVTRQPSVFLGHFGLKLEAAPKQDRASDTAEKFAFQPGPYTKGVRKIISRGHRGLDSSSPKMVVHVRSKWGVLMAVTEEGKGRVMAFADPDLFSNEALRQGGHSRFALNLLLTHLEGGILLVDEYHHGYGRAASVLEHLGGSGALVPMLQGLFCLLVLWAAKGRRFGPPRPLPKEERRSALEYVRAMAQLFQRAQARSLACSTVSRWIEDEARKVLVHRDRHLQKALQDSRQRFIAKEQNERELLLSVQRLYLALDGARRRAAGEAVGSKE